MKKNLAVIFILTVTGITSWLWFKPSGLKWAPDVTFSTLEGEKINMRELRGQPVLVTFWATTCPGCLKEMPHLVELYEEFDGGGFELIGVAMAYDPPNRVLELTTERQLPYPIALDIDGAIATAFGNVMLTPTSFLIAPDGRIIKHESGEMNIHKLRQQIENLLPARTQVKRVKGDRFIFSEREQTTFPRASVIPAKAGIQSNKASLKHALACSKAGAAHCFTGCWHSPA